MIFCALGLAEDDHLQQCAAGLSHARGCGVSLGDAAVNCHLGSRSNDRRHVCLSKAQGKERWVLLIIGVFFKRRCSRNSSNV